MRFLVGLFCLSTLANTSFAQDDSEPIVTKELKVPELENAEPVGVVAPGTSEPAEDDVKEIPSAEPAVESPPVIPAEPLPAPKIIEAKKPTIEERLSQLEAQVLNMDSRPQSSQAPCVAEPLQSITQLGPAASKIYTQTRCAWQFGLSSEFVTYQKRSGVDGTTTKLNRTNVMSFSPVFAAHLHPRLIFNSQLSFDNGGSESSNTVTLRKGSSIVLQAYIDWLSSERGHSGLRLGHQLIPMGFVNTTNEPGTYYGVLKPELERELIPSTWHENGLSYWTDTDSVDFQVGVFNSLDSSGFESDSFLAGGRNNGQNAAAEDLMGVVRVNVKSENLTLGGSFAIGNTAQRAQSVPEGGFHLAEFHVRAQTRRLDFQLMAAQGDLKDADEISIARNQTIARRAQGVSSTLAYNWKNRRDGLWTFARFSRYNLNDLVDSSYEQDPTLNKKQWTVGLNYFPIPQLVLKVDYAFKSTQAGDDDDEFSLGAGLSF